ncbi:hypothetical protein CDAR_42821 [Caerostris darwini]|uniref:Uncharacterized protein n=1 Tax=Caerostris darwini TaxID=1538125 RepID=A0AAV4WG58_9ARAC|nr:hypothetical protein CDAR_42821 [Caerostris darwini]
MKCQKSVALLCKHPRIAKLRFICFHTSNSIVNPTYRRVSDDLQSPWHHQLNPCETYRNWDTNSDTKPRPFRLMPILLCMTQDSVSVRTTWGEQIYCHGNHLHVEDTMGAKWLSLEAAISSNLFP